MKNKCWQGCEELGTLIMLVGISNNAVTMENSLAVPQKVKYRISLRSRHPTSGHMQKELRELRAGT